MNPSTLNRDEPPRWPTPEPAEGFDPLRDVTDRQRHVIEAIVAGNPIAEVARICDVPRSTVYLWLKSSLPFITALNWRRKVEYEHATDLLRLADQAAATRLLNLLEDGDIDTLMGYLRARGIGKISTAPTGPTDVDAVIAAETEARYRQRERELIDEDGLARVAEYDGVTPPRRAAIREAVEDDFRRQAHRAAHAFQPDDTPDGSFEDT